MSANVDVKRPLIALSLTAVWAAGCATSPSTWGPQVAAGPVIGYSAERGVTLGWEAGGGVLGGPNQPNTSSAREVNMVAHGNVGMSWRKAPGGVGPFAPILYAAWEPAVGPLGATLGYAYAPGEGGAPMLGGWAGAGLTSDWTHCSPCTTFSLALGVRWDGTPRGGSEIYLAPKVGLVHGVTLSLGD